MRRLSIHPLFILSLGLLLGLSLWLGSQQVRAEDETATAEPQAEVGQPQLDLPRERLRIGNKLVEVQVASTPEQRQMGLMWRQEMPADEGMLFMFPEAQMQCFWMRNTLLPLTAAFLDEQGRVVNFADMQPLSEASHCSEAPVRYVLELHQGWFHQRGLGAWNQVQIIRDDGATTAASNP